jgi:transcriptional regulator with XRE-family HTH domain
MVVQMRIRRPKDRAGIAESRSLLKRLQKYQLESGLSRYRLAELIGVSFPSVYYWLDGSTTPEKESREKLRRFLEREGY